MGEPKPCHLTGGWFGPYYIRQRSKHIPRMMRARPETASPFRDERPVFIIGSVRSGNTLLRAILSCSGQLVIPPESHVLPEVIAKFREYGFLPWPELVQLLLAEFAVHPAFGYWNMGVNGAYERALRLPEDQRTLAGILASLYAEYSLSRVGEERRWGDKSPRNYVALPRIDRVFPNAQYIHILRDGADAVASSMRAGIFQTPEVAARRWVKGIGSCQRFGEVLPGRRFLEIRYEDLVTAPETTAQGVAEFLGLQFDQSWLNFHEQAQTLGDTSRSQHRMVAQPISSGSIGKGRHALTTEQRERIRPIMERELQRLGYEGLGPVVEGARG